jgi:hypothetical protein
MGAAQLNLLLQRRGELLGRDFARFFCMSPPGCGGAVSEKMC